MVDLKKFGERVKKERKRLDLTQEELSDRLGGGNRSRITVWEAGKLKEFPSLEVVDTLADIFSCDIEYLLGIIDGRTRAETDISKETGLSDEEVQGLSTICKHAKKKGNIKAKDRQDPFVNAHFALKKLLSQAFNSTAIPGLVVLSYINLYLESEGTADINDFAYDIAGLNEEDVALTAITKALTNLKQANGGANNGKENK